MIDTLCLAGGGVKGICYISAIKYLEKVKFLNLKNIKNFVGTSVGSILNFFFILGYSCDELKDFILSFDFNKLTLDMDFDNFFDSYGMDNGQKFIITIKTFLTEKLNVKDITFLELYNLTKKDLIIITTNYTKVCTEIFSYKETPNVSILLALRMSMSLPLVFSPVKYNDNFYIDGGLTYNFGLKFCNPDTTFGLSFSNRKDNKMDSFMNYLNGLLNILSDSITMNSINKLNKYCLNYKFIEIDCEFENPMDLNLTKEKIILLLKNGTISAEKYYNNFIINDILENIIDKIIKDNN